ncbi:hypothetical protein [Petroclostridium sp. X23]|uniref:hypothetical protein n=1 Tax=Petroclostridium sp. X23 TaxID=3045146 RepID=UPI0024ACE9BF|nr:hypothetical protein [Petroclostridium sp. X23]WHH58309.1 hypothetical protein QKW49_21295 [Petroclostridium sp. X23]
MSTKTKADQEATAAPQEAKYSKDELMVAAEAAFAVKPEVVMAAMKMAGITEATKAEAKAAIDKFNKKEVK